LTPMSFRRLESRADRNASHVQRVFGCGNEKLELEGELQVGGALSCVSGFSGRAAMSARPLLVGIASDALPTPSLPLPSMTA
jgi:hypothetical protein